MFYGRCCYLHTLNKLVPTKVFLQPELIGSKCVPQPQSVGSLMKNRWHDGDCDQAKARFQKFSKTTKHSMFFCSRLISWRTEEHVRLFFKP